ncbi:MAG: hypothetical protein GY716_01345 [bacterium]|nr:hypothetical protein [bacterium]
MRTKLETRPRTRGLFIVIVGLLIAGVAAAQDIPLGTDCWTTEGPTTIELPVLPSGFFGTKAGTPSDPRGAQVVAMNGLPLPNGVVTGDCECPPVEQVELVWVDQHGTPVEPDDRHKVKQQEVVSQGVPQNIDTCVRRLGVINFAGVGTPEQVDIRLIQLSLKSIAPITVTYGGQPSSQFRVFVEESGSQTQGMMTFTPSATSGGEFSGDVVNDSLFVDFVITFEDLASIQTTPNPLSPMSIEFINTAGTFDTDVIQTVPAMDDWALALLIVVLAAIAVTSLYMLRRRQQQTSHM